jgi:hypothetical protein
VVIVWCRRRDNDDEYDGDDSEGWKGCDNDDDDDDARPNTRRWTNEMGDVG